MCPCANGLEQIAGDGRNPLESKTGIDLKINNHHPKYCWLPFIALPLSLYPCLKSKLAAGFKCFVKWLGQPLIHLPAPSVAQNINNHNKTNWTNWKRILGRTACLLVKARIFHFRGHYNSLQVDLWYVNHSLINAPVTRGHCLRAYTCVQDSCRKLQKPMCSALNGCAAFRHIMETQRPPCGAWQNQSCK